MRLPSKFGRYGGQFVPETLMPALAELEEAYLRLQADPAFAAELDHLLTTYVGRPTPLTHARRLTEHLGGAQVYLKRQQCARPGAAGEGHRQAPRYRGDRRGAARGRVGHGSGAARPRMYRLHGIGA